MTVVTLELLVLLEVLLECCSLFFFGLDQGTLGGRLAIALH